ncbi:MAG: hypothetical protein U1E50_17125 [Caulobacteraceae bacterium]
MTRWLAGLVCAVLCVSSAVADESSELRRAREASVEDLRKEAFAEIADAFVEVERPTFSGMLGPRAPSVLYFATKPRSAGFPGLCQATVVGVRRLPIDDIPPVRAMSTYRVVGDLSPLPGLWNDAYGARLEALCEKAGRVLRTESGDLGQVAFFRAAPDDSGTAYVGARALELAIKNAASADLDVTCDMPRDSAGAPLARADAEIGPGQPGPHDCDDARGALAALSLSRLVGLSMEPCADDAKLSCLKATFVRGAADNMQFLWMLDLRARVVREDSQNEVTVLAVKMFSSWMNYD